MFYAYTTDGFLSFFANDCTVCGKLTFPSGEIVQWEIFYSLVQKILVRLSRVEEISKEYNLNKKFAEKSDYLEKAFILNKYFTEEDVPKISEHIDCLRNRKKKPNISEASKKFILTEEMYKNFESKV